jgi:hypothetical protein
VLDATVRLLSGFFSHPEHGINEMTQSLPRAGLGGAPDDAAPPVVAIFNDVDDKSVAKDLTAPQLPAWILWGDSSAPVSLAGYKIAREVVVAGAFVTDEGVDDLVMNRACGYILRGGLITMARYNSQDNSKGYRELNGIKVHMIQSVTEQRVTAAVGRQKMWGFLYVRAIVVETYS